MRKNRILLAMLLLLAFALWTLAVSFVDVAAVGPRDSAVGFSTLNVQFHKFTGTNMMLYHITDWLGLVPVAVGFGFAVFGLVQWIQRKKIHKVDEDILVLGGFYLLTLFAYLFFEEVVVNYRPVLINGYLEASYPSSTTLLVLCVNLTAMLQFQARIKNKKWNKAVQCVSAVFVTFMVIGRLLSGVHWLTDIVGGVILSAGLVTLYAGVAALLTPNAFSEK